MNQPKFNSCTITLPAVFVLSLISITARKSTEQTKCMGGNLNEVCAF